MNDVTTILHYAFEDLVELLPYFFLAVFISAMVDILYLDIVARRSFKKHGLLGIVFTTLIGALSPFCSFTVIPLIRKLLRTGVPLSAVMAFWIASPAMDPPIFALTAAQIGLPLATARLLGALALSFGAGLLIYVLEKRGMFLNVLRQEAQDGRVDGRALVSDEVAAEMGAVQPALVGARASDGNGVDLPAASPLTTVEVAADQACATSCDAPATADDDDNTPWWPTAKASLRSKRNWRITGRNFVKDSLGLGKWLVFACVFEGTIRVFVPTSIVTDTLGADVGLLAIPLATFLAVPLYLNGVGAIPIVAGLLDKGMADGAAISFMLGGAITTIPAMVAVRSVVNNRVFALYLAIGIVGSILLGFLAQLLL